MYMNKTPISQKTPRPVDPLMMMAVALGILLLAMGALMTT